MQTETQTGRDVQPAARKEKTAPVLKIPKDDLHPALVAVELLCQEGFTFDISTPPDDGQLEIRPATRADYESLSAVMQTPEVRALMAALSGTELEIDGFGWPEEIRGRIETGFLISRAALTEGLAAGYREELKSLDQIKSKDEEESEEQEKSRRMLGERLASLRDESKNCREQATTRLGQRATGNPTQEDIRLILAPLVEKVSRQSGQ